MGELRYRTRRSGPGRGPDRPRQDERPSAFRRGVGRTHERKGRPNRRRRSRGPSAVAVFITVFAVTLLVMGKDLGARVSGALAGAGTPPSSAAGPAPLIGARSCAALEAHGQPTPVRRRHPSYSAWLDRDNDGWACEPMPKRRW